MAEIKADKKTDSINALKNANKHLADIFTDLAKKERTMSTCADDLLRVAKQCGELRISYYMGNETKVGSLKTYLEAIANSLNEAR